ncbi:MAG: aminotransferase class I/II-fold pyridoxal phosphate-dependent enzyme [Spirochaetales bacterium]|nr:aminotransferase class I/II-fold pyridoxal phosphate-dependent enzyme [Spirochaetales bacterium]
MESFEKYKKDIKNKGFATRAIRWQLPRTEHQEHSVPLYLTSSFVFEDAEEARSLFADEKQGSIYSRFSNPSVDEFIQKMCLLEEADDGVAFASGMAAVFGSLIPFLSAGDHVLACRAIFGSTHQILNRILPRWQISHTYLDARARPEEWEAARRPQTRLIIVETPSNPGLDVLDLEWLGRFAREHGILLLVDNCFATPYLQQPVRSGAHLVLHSATKFIDGQGRAVGGIVVGDRDLIKEVRFFARHSGPSLSPFHAWLFSKSLETLALRMERHSTSALELARFLETQPAVERVIYPFLDSHPDFALAKKQMKMGGGVLSFILRGGLESGKRFLGAQEMLSHTANLGDTRTIVTHPASTTHSRLTEEERLAVGILPGLIRVSVGLEDLPDLIEDLTRCIAAAG